MIRSFDTVLFDLDGTLTDPKVGITSSIRYAMQKLKRPLSPQDITHLLHLADLPAELAQQDSHALSGGQAQRVAIARTLATEPSALLLDEPTSALDPASTKHVEETMLKLRQTLGLTLLWVTHNPDQAKRIADRVVLLVNGRIVVDTGIGIPAEHLPHIFDRFYRVDKARNRMDGGTGLGLAVVQAVANSHNGQARCVSGTSGGARFEIILPVYQEAPGASYTTVASQPIAVTNSTEEQHNAAH